MNSNICYMCDAVAVEDEHAPPKCIFPEMKDTGGVDYRKNLIKVPSCKTHNSQTSKDDEYFAAILVLFAEANQVATNQFLSKWLRAAARKPHVYKSFLKDGSPVWKDGRTQYGFAIDRARLDGSIDKLTRALYFHKYNTTFPYPIIQIHCPNLLDTADIFVSPNTQVRSLVEKIKSVFGDSPYSGDNSDVFKYRLYHYVPDKMFVLQCVFYGAVEFCAFSSETVA